MVLNLQPINQKLTCSVLIIEVLHANYEPHEVHHEHGGHHEKVQHAEPPAPVDPDATWRQLVLHDASTLQKSKQYAILQYYCTVQRVTFSFLSANSHTHQELGLPQPFRLGVVWKALCDDHKQGTSSQRDPEQQGIGGIVLV